MNSSITTITGIFTGRARNMVLRPRAEWQAIKKEEATYRSIIAGYGAILAAIPPSAAVAERFLFGRNIVHYAENAPLGYVLATNALWYLVIIINVIITGAVISAIAGRNEGWFGVRGIALAVYSFTPLFLVCILTMVPGLGWLVYVAILYSLYLLYLGIESVYGVEKRKAAWYAAASFAAAGLILGVLNTFEYMLESVVAGKIFF